MLLAAAPAQAITASSGFPDGGEQWAGRNASPGQSLPEGASLALTHFPGGGDVSGWLGVNDPDSGTGEDLSAFAAPAAYLGDARANYGGALSFKLYTNGPASREVEVVLSGPTENLVTGLGVPANNVWDPQSVPLTESGWTFEESGTQPTPAEFVFALSNLEGSRSSATTRPRPSRPGSTRWPWPRAPARRRSTGR